MAGDAVIGHPPLRIEPLPVERRGTTIIRCPGPVIGEQVRVTVTQPYFGQRRVYPRARL